MKLRLDLRPRSGVEIQLAMTTPTGPDDAALPGERPREVSVDLDGGLHRAKMLAEFADEPAVPLDFRQWRVERLLGSGGMGKVYLATHKQLGRPVALKVLKPVAGDSERSTSRLIREAQAMALVRHDNVLQVHHVDTSGERVVIEMEYIEGPTLREWQSTPGRNWRTIVEAYLGVADGLAALHAADILHRDIKPDNLLVDIGDRVKIGDLGLAVASRETSAKQGSGRASENSALALRLTEDGAIIGTLGYMAPEVLLGDPITKAADQFSLAVSLYEAIYGVRPFAGASAEALADSIADGRLAKPPDGRRRPAWLLRSLRRALSSDPAQRHGSVAEFAQTLQRGLARRRWLGGLLSFAVVLIGLPTATWLAKPAADDPCTQAGEAIGVIWNDEARDELTRRSQASNTPEAPRSLAVLERVLDHHAQAWREASTELCISRRSAPDAAEVLQAEIDERQRACLGTVEFRLSAMLARLRATDLEVSRHFTEAAAEIEAMPTCDDRRVMANWPKISPDPEVESALAEALALESRGEFVAAEQAAALAVERTRGRDPLRQAEALYRLGHIRGLARRYDDALASLDDARNVAYANGQDQLVCRALAFQVKLRAVVGEAPIEAARELGFAHACVERVGAQSPILHADLREAEGVLARASGDFEAAVHHHEQALVLRRSYFGDDHSDVAKSLLNLANALADAGRSPDAEQRYQQCIELRTRLLGGGHPELADALFDAGVFDWTQAKSEQARTSLLRAHAIYSRDPGTHALALARIHQVLASIDLELGLLDAGAEQLEQMRRLLESGQNPTPQTVDLARWQHLHGELALRRQDYETAADALRRAAALHRRHAPEGSETFAAIVAEIQADYGIEDFPRIAAIVRDEGSALEDFVRSMAASERSSLAWYVALALRDQGMQDDAKTYFEIALDAYQALEDVDAVDQLRDALNR